MIFALALAAALSSAGATDRTETKVVVEGGTYRVMHRADGYVEAAKKSVFVVADPRLHARLHAAVRQATGCELIDDYWIATMLTGRLDCSPGARSDLDRAASPSQQNGALPSHER